MVQPVFGMHSNAGNQSLACFDMACTLLHMSYPTTYMAQLVPYFISGNHIEVLVRHSTVSRAVKRQAVPVPKPVLYPRAFLLSLNTVLQGG